MKKLKCFFNDKRFYYTLFSGILFGLFAHLFGITNIIRNHDSWGGINSYGAGISSGRWGLELLGELMNITYGSTNLSFFNGIISILLLSLSAYIVVRIFDIKKPLLCVLWSGLFVAFPVVTSTMLYTFTVSYYAFAIFLAVLSVYLSLRGNKWLFLSIPLAAFSVGIYQAYFPMMITLYLLVLIDKSINGKYNFKEILFLGLKYLGILIGSISLYFIILKLCLFFFSTELTGYQGIDNMGKFTLETFIYSITRSFSNFFTMPFRGNSNIAHNIASTGFLKILFFTMNVITTLYLGYILYIKRKDVINKQKGIVFLLLLILPIGIDSIILMCPRSIIHNLMVYSWIFVFIIPLLLIDKKYKVNNKIKIVFNYSIIIIISLILFGYIQDSNTNYSAIYYANRQANNYWNSVITSIKSTPSFDTSLEWAFIGRANDPLYYNPWKDEDIYNMTTDNIITIDSYKNFIYENIGYKVPFVDDNELSKLKDSDVVKDMPSYPNYGSIKIYDNKVIVKFA